VDRIFTLIAAVSGFLSVAIGAFAAHGLAEKVDEHMLEIFKTGALYQTTQSLALLAVAILVSKSPLSRALFISGWAFVFGIVVFSGSLYLLVLLNMPVLGAITPVGGVGLLVGWLCLCWHCWQTYTN